jgi:hypothetical protein
MTYSTSAPPRLLVPAFTGVGNIWWYTSAADASAAIDAAGFISNGAALGMKVGDLLIFVDTATPTTPLITTHVVMSVTAGGAANLGAGTTVGSTTTGD